MAMTGHWPCALYHTVGSLLGPQDAARSGCRIPPAPTSPSSTRQSLEWGLATSPDVGHIWRASKQLSEGLICAIETRSSFL